MNQKPKENWRRLLEADAVVMGILNLTPDSFSDGGLYNLPDQALVQAMRMREEGADIIDVGGESTRPGAQPVSIAEELDRVLPVIEALSSQDIPVSIDTSKPEVMQAAINAGAQLVNDVNGLRAEGAVDVLVKYPDVDCCIMHMQGKPRTMQANPCYEDVVADVKTFFQERIAACLARGISKDRIILDPGIGFGKKLEHNLNLIKALPQLRQLGFKVLIGISRKSMIGQILNQQMPGQRVIGSVAAAVMAYQLGAQLFRVHDVLQTVEALKVARAIQHAQLTN